MYVQYFTLDKEEPLFAWRYCNADFIMIGIHTFAFPPKTPQLMAGNASDLQPIWLASVKTFSTHFSRTVLHFSFVDAVHLNHNIRVFKIVNQRKYQAIIVLLRWKKSNSSVKMLLMLYFGPTTWMIQVIESFPADVVVASPGKNLPLREVKHVFISFWICTPS